MAARAISGSSLLQKTASLALVLVVTSLAFMAGTIVTWYRLPPFQTIQDAFRGASAAVDVVLSYRNPTDADLYGDVVFAGSGVTRYLPEKAANGLTLYTSGHANAALLIDMAGKVVHQWSLPYSRVWDATAEVERPRSDAWIYFRKALLFPNGDLITTYYCAGATPWGCGLVKMDKDSKVLWKYLRPTHHDVDVAPDGRVFTLTQRIVGEPIELAPDDSNPPYLVDGVAVLSPDGRELQHVDLVEAFRGTPFASILKQAPITPKGDFMHANAVEYIDAGRAGWSPRFGPNAVMISLREVSLLAVLDLDREKIVWATRGPWVKQHDPDLLDNGHILLFDNLGHLGEGGRSRILEIDPKTLGIVWSFSGSATERLDSEVRGEQQRLENGNTLITESESGRLLEVTPAGEVVWEYLNPARFAHGTRIGVLSSGRRFDPATLTFLERDRPIAAATAPQPLQ